MKKVAIIVLIVFVSLFAIGFSINQSFLTLFGTSVLSDFPECERAERYYSDGFRDYTDYCKYYFSQEDNVAETLKESKYFKLATVDDVEEIKGYFENFEGWVEFEDYKKNYDFKREWIDTDDYYYIESKYELDKYESYDVYFFDTQTNILYFIHSNT